MATLRERLDVDLKDAMRAKDELRLNTIRAVKSAVKYKEVEGTAKTLDDPGIIAVVTTLMKQRKEAFAEFTKAGRADLADKEQKEADILLTYLPKQLSAEELAHEVRNAIAQTQAKSPKDLGAVMKVLSTRLKGQVEGKALSDEVKAQLSALG